MRLAMAACSAVVTSWSVVWRCARPLDESRRHDFFVSSGQWRWPPRNSGASSYMHSLVLTMLTICRQQQDELCYACMLLMRVCMHCEAVLRALEHRLTFIDCRTTRLGRSDCCRSPRCNTVGPTYRSVETIMSLRFHSNLVALGRACVRA